MHAGPWASSTPLLGPTDLRPTGRLNASSRHVCASGPMGESGTTVHSVPHGCLRSWLTTTPAGPIRHWATVLQPPASVGITYCNLTPSPPLEVGDFMGSFPLQ